MKIKVKLIINIFFIFYFVGCHSSMESDMINISIDISQNKPVPLSLIADNVDTIDLEATGSSLLSDIFQVDMLNGCYFIKDKNPELKVFDSRGKFIRLIGKEGRGPGEYNYCTNFTIDSKNERLFLKTNVGIMEYDLDGNFIKRHYIENLLPIEIYYHDNILYLLRLNYEKNMRKDGYTQQDSYFSTLDSNLNLIDHKLLHRFTSNIYTRRTLGRSNYISCKESHLYVFHPDLSLPYENSSDTLYIVDKSNLKPYLTMQFTQTGNLKPYLQNIFVVDRYAVAYYYFPTTKEIVTPEELGYSHFIYDFETKEYMNVRNGFEDDFHHNSNVIITPTQNNMFYYLNYREEFSNARTEPNPTLYIGAFKK